MTATDPIAPEAAPNRPQLPSKRDLEHGLRGMGLSARQAKKLLSGGYAALGAVDDEAEEVKELLQQVIRKLGK